MKNIITIISIIFFTFCHSQNIDKLKSDNGFRDIKLGKNVNNYPDFIKKSSKNEEYFGAWGWNYDYILHQGSDSKFKKLGDSKIYRIFAKVNENIIYEISLALDKNYDIIEMLEYAYGKPTFENNELGIKRWTTDNNIECELQGFSTALEFSHYYITYTNTSLQSKAWNEQREQKKKRAISEF